MRPHFRTAAGLSTVHDDPSTSLVRRRFNHQLDHDDFMGNFTAADERFEPLVVVSTAFNEEAPRPGKVSICALVVFALSPLLFFHISLSLYLSIYFDFCFSASTLEFPRIYLTTATTTNSISTLRHATFKPT